ncbi:MAG: hypothetical protein R3305_04805, partial [Gammaproteobacteria bacterium]|nr:hypothetical protein [Gammaproteobacteria bacterium]
DLPFVPYAPALSHHGVDLSRMLLVHPSPGRADALWAVEQAIRSQSSVAALAWVKQADIAALRRLQLGAETYRCWTVLFRPLAAINESSPATLRFSLAPACAPSEVNGTSGRVRIDIRKCRGRRPHSLLL